MVGPRVGTFCDVAGGTNGLNGTLPRRVTRKPLKARGYLHFDKPLPEEALEAFQIEDADVASHSFFPLLGYTKVERRMDFDDDMPLLDKKPREIRYAAHKDSAIYAFYARDLSPRYDARLNSAGLGGSILAYRSGIGNNVAFAKGLIDEIKARRDCQVACLDISKFFDSIRHDGLKRQLSLLLETPRLPAHWFKILTRLTAYEYVLQDDIEVTLGRTRPPQICDINTFREKVRPLIRRHDKAYGIPQGTPLSGLFANIYMLEFDRTALGLLDSLGGSYRRYSDDIALVLPPGADLAGTVHTLTERLSAVGLATNEKKTCISQFAWDGSRLVRSGDECQYLGFTFDGEKTLIRSASMRRFYSRMKGEARRYIRAAAKKGIPANQLRKRVLIGKYTHWGDARNFVQYAYRASELLGAPEIKRQLRNHVPIFDAHWARMIQKYYVAPAAVAA